MSLQMHISVQVYWSTKYSSSPSKLPSHNFALCIFLCLFCICIFNNRRCVLCLQNWPAIICHQLPYAPQKGTLRSNMSFIHKPRSIFCRIHWKLWLFEISKKKTINKKQIKVGEDTHIDLLFVCFTPTAKCFLFSTPVMLPSILTGGVQHIVFKVPLHQKEKNFTGTRNGNILTHIRDSCPKVTSEWSLVKIQSVTFHWCVPCSNKIWRIFLLPSVHIFLCVPPLKICALSIKPSPPPKDPQPTPLPRVLASIS